LIVSIIVSTDAFPTLAEIEASTVIAKDSTVAKDATVAKAATVALDATVAKATAVTTLQATADAVPTLSEIEASTVLAKEATTALIRKLIKNKKILTNSGGVYSLVVYDDNDIDELMRKVIKDVSGADIATIGAGVIVASDYNVGSFPVPVNAVIPHGERCEFIGGVFTRPRQPPHRGMVGNVKAHAGRSRARVLPPRSCCFALSNGDVNIVRHGLFQPCALAGVRFRAAHKIGRVQDVKRRLKRFDHHAQDGGFVYGDKLRAALFGIKLP